MLTMGITGRMVTDLVGAGNVTSYGGRFTAQVFPGDTLTGKLFVDEVDYDTVKMTITTTNQNGVVVFSGLRDRQALRRESPSCSAVGYAKTSPPLTSRL